MVEIISNYFWVFLLGEYPHGPVGGLAMTLVLSVLALTLTFPAAVVVAVARTHESAILRGVSAVLVYSIRSIPLLMVLFWIYYFLPLLIGRPISAFSTILFGIIVYQTAYLSEVIRAAIDGLPRGQTEAARAIGMSYRSTTIHIVLPQALQNAIPGILNQFIIVIKETSLGYVFAFNELTYAASQVNSMELTKPLQVYTVLALVYFVICYGVSKIAAGIEFKLASRSRNIG